MRPLPWASKRMNVGDIVGLYRYSSWNARKGSPIANIVIMVSILGLMIEQITINEWAPSAAAVEFRLYLLNLFLFCQPVKLYSILVSILLHCYEHLNVGCISQV